MSFANEANRAFILRGPHKILFYKLRVVFLMSNTLFKVKATIGNVISVRNKYINHFKYITIIWIYVDVFTFFNRTSQSNSLVYVKGQNIPYEEDLRHEYKGYRNFAVEEIPKEAAVNKTRKPISRSVFFNLVSITFYLFVNGETGALLGFSILAVVESHIVVFVTAEL